LAALVGLTGGQPMVVTGNSSSGQMEREKNSLGKENGGRENAEVEVVNRRSCRAVS
jgi:hypothetical protein